MKKRITLPSLLILVAALSLCWLFVFPLWKITLGAPQYPQDLEMYIWINKITGDTEYTLQTINILNHYIGMRPIEPDAFKELQYMPWIVAGLIILGVLAALFHKRVVLATWVVMLIAAGAVGLWDFYRWEVDFGTHLDPKAPIKLEGMTYAPPFLGEKTLLNIEATSYPDLGALVLGISVLLGLIAIWINWRPTARVYGKTRKYAVGSVLWLSLLGLVACNKGPSPIKYGFDMCHFCKMTISDQRYGSEVITKKGKVFKFDSVECLAHFLQDSEIPPESYHAIYVTDFTQPAALVHGKEAYYLFSQQLPSPMGAYLTAFASASEAEAFQEEKGGEIVHWEAMTQKLK